MKQDVPANQLSLEASQACAVFLFLSRAEGNISFIDNNDIFLSRLTLDFGDNIGCGCEDISIASYISFFFFSFFDFGDKVAGGSGCSSSGLLAVLICCD